MVKHILLVGETIAILVIGVVFAGAGEDPTTHPDPLPLSTIRSDHPRLWFNSDNIHLLRLRWDDPVYEEVVTKYKGKSDAVSLALEGLATENIQKCSEAAAKVGFAYSATGGGNHIGYVDPISLVFDWCYNYLDTVQKADLVSKIETLRDQHKDHPQTGIRSFFRWHETFRFSSFAYIASVLAIEGEPGVSSELREAQNVLQNLQELGDEVSGDGGYRDYFYQGDFQTLPFLMWSYATDMDFASVSQFTQHLVEWAVYKLSPTGSGNVRGPGDDGALRSGYTRNHLAPGNFYLLASHFNDPVARWIGRHMEEKFYQHSPQWQFGGPAFTSLILDDPSNLSLSPSEVGMPLAAFFDTSGMVHVRSSWETGPEVIHAWFYNGPATEHSGETQNHFTVWRGDDPLIMKGGNYLGKPSTYHSHFYERAVSNNVLLFSPYGSSSPDHDGGQVRRWANTELSRQTYPVAERVGSWRGQHIFNGRIVDFEDSGQYVVASANAALAYNPDHVLSCVRDFVYLRPNIFLIRDRFSTSGVTNIRSLIHSRRKPLYVGTPTIVEGGPAAGILEIVAESFRLQNGDSEAGVEILWPPEPTLRFIGGPGYEGYADGYNADPATDSQNWLHGTEELEERAGLIEGQWRTEITVLPAQAGGDMVLAVFVSEKDPASRPVYSTRMESEGLVVYVTQDFRTRVVVFPESGSPVVGIGVARRSPSGRRSANVLKTMTIRR